jgi:hypothetical protein
MTAKATPGRSASIAAAVARRAACSFDSGCFIDPEQSTMMISAAAGDLPPPARLPPVAVTVTIALTSLDRRGRYSFW